MSKQEFDSALYAYLSKGMSYQNAYDICVILRGFLDTKPTWVIVEHDGSNDEHA